MSEIEGIYAVWLREFKIYLREKERMVASMISPVLWIFGFGAGLGSQVAIHGINYQVFIFPGVMVMTMLFTCVFYGMYVIWDRKLDFLKAVLVAPLSRRGVFAGKMLGGITDAMIQVCVLFLLAIILGIPLNPYSFAVCLVSLFMIATCMTSLGLFFGAALSSMESFQLIAQLVVWPLFFFSGALFPLDNLPAWLSAVTYLDPLTYGVDAMRGAMFGIGNLPLHVDLLALALFAVILMCIGSIEFSRMGKL